ncbi:M15 family metallopeptidase [Chamaesiphon sp. VAR_48_metabat_403]|uniref:M15 family metallopeptidase n=1 Tax=Chamaesiphon sp. VAR_48_metabat_403 TaxID=2964700 RepID=UPI00286E68B4|nr:M15 family metallopeptidase [Chamaesiphon sp. VAR_48_metabat_403]
MLKPYRQVPIQECGEPLVAIPLELFAIETPHPYIKCGADYDGKSPYYLRQGVLDRLIQAQDYLQQIHPGWRIQIFDAYRPVQVQQYMVDYTFHQTVRDRQLDLANLSAAQQQEIWDDVYQVWAIPTFDLATPPPHSTGAAIDITLVDEDGEPVNMGSPIDEMSDRSLPEYFANALDPIEIQYHQNRQLLDRIMTDSGTIRHPSEWWHFSCGDQLWAWLKHQVDPLHPLEAFYGRVI